MSTGTSTPLPTAAPSASAVLGGCAKQVIVVDQPTIGQTYSDLVEDLGGALARAQGYARPHST